MDFSINSLEKYHFHELQIWKAGPRYFKNSCVQRLAVLRGSALQNLTMVYLNKVIISWQDTGAFLKDLKKQAPGQKGKRSLPESSALGAHDLFFVAFINVTLFQVCVNQLESSRNDSH